MHFNERKKERTNDERKDRQKEGGGEGRREGKERMKVTILKLWFSAIAMVILIAIGISLIMKTFEVELYIVCM